MPFYTKIGDGEVDPRVPPLGSAGRNTLTPDPAERQGRNGWFLGVAPGRRRLIMVPMGPEDTPDYRKPGSQLPRTVRWNPGFSCSSETVVSCLVVFRVGKPYILKIQ